VHLKITFTVLVLILAFSGSAQLLTVVSGKVTEASTGTPVPFANVLFQGTTIGAITDFDGNYRIQISQAVDSVEVRYVGYLTKTKAVFRGQQQILNVQLEEDVQTLGEVIIYAGENPAFEVLRNVVRNKPINDKRQLDAYEYEIYTKIELDMDNLSDRLKRSAVMKKISSVLDSIEIIAGEDGQPVMPVFFSETLSDFYFRNDPRLKHEHILKTNLLGVGLTDGTTTAQIIGASFQEYNFYLNWLNIVSKDFVSPIADGWRIYYEYDLTDSLMVGDDYCYRLDFFPKSAQDLAFNGTMWITKEHFALKRIDATVTSTANLNYIEKIKIQQDLIRTSSGPWLPEKSRVVVDIAQITPNTAGLLAKFYTSIKDVQVNQPRSTAFYEMPVKLDPAAQTFDQYFWRENRHDSLTMTEENVYIMVDTLKKIPVIQQSMNAFKFAATGYFSASKIDVGPYYTFFGNNDIEGLRFGIGARTNYQLSKKWTLGGYLAYGIADERWKYQAYYDLVLDKVKWTNITLTHQREVDQVWTLTRNVSPNSLFYSLSRFGNLVNPFTYQKSSLKIFRQYRPAWSQSLEVKQQDFSPLYDFSFRPDADQDRILSDFSIFEVTLSTRFAKDEVFLVNDNERWSMGTNRWPAISFDYTIGLTGVLGSDLSYHRMKFNLLHKQTVGFLGTSRFELQGGKVFGDVPYPLLYNPIGNETPIYASFAYNMMNFFEFSSDTYASLRYRHSFEGLILNKVPLMRRLKWRLVANANVIYGEMSDRNRDLVNYPLDEFSVQQLPFTTLGEKPYIELGYGIENIFKIFRVDAFHRITYLDRPDVNKFGLKFSLQFIL
jgi:hypothetical protein